MGPAPAEVRHSGLAGAEGHAADLDVAAAAAVVVAVGDARGAADADADADAHGGRTPPAGGTPRTAPAGPEVDPTAAGHMARTCFPAGAGAEAAHARGPGAA